VRNRSAVQPHRQLHPEHQSRLVRSLPQLLHLVTRHQFHPHWSIASNTMANVNISNHKPPDFILWKHCMPVYCTWCPVADGHDSMPVSCESWLEHDGNCRASASMPTTAGVTFDICCATKYKTIFKLWSSYHETSITKWIAEAFTEPIKGCILHCTGWSTKVTWRKLCQNTDDVAKSCVSANSHC
jgi:hypothetical protein